jgi:hypothetical protein
LALLLAVLILTGLTGAARAIEPDHLDSGAAPPPDHVLTPVVPPPARTGDHGGIQSATQAGPILGSSRTDTLWIFDADFEDLVGDNAGWTSGDYSGTLAFTNYWHKDTIRINGFAHLGDSTWWCGTYDPCWIQPRGYGNDWVCYLSREFPLSSWSEPGDEVVFEWDQRLAMELDYDYGYVEVSTDGGSTWTTIATFTDPGFAGSHGVSQDWDSEHPGFEGHQRRDLNALAGVDVTLRFRFESDPAYSSQDSHDNPPLHSCLDGAWQLDNFKWTVNETVRWYDDCESPGDNGWVHDDIPATGQTGVTYRRSFETFDGHAGWMMAAYDSVAGAMVDNQRNGLVSPPIDVAGASPLVAQWQGWLDIPRCSNGYVDLWTFFSDVPGCERCGTIVTFLPTWGPLYGGPMWVDITQPWGGPPREHCRWLTMKWGLHSGVADSAGCHGVGFVLDRVRVGVQIETGVPEEEVARAWIARVHPNPFGPTTTIEYGIGAPAQVTLRVFDLAGRVVRTLADRGVDVGDHKVVWDGTSDSGSPVASGVYFVQLECGGDVHVTTSVAVRKLVLLR